MFRYFLRNRHSRRLTCVGSATGRLDAMHPAHQSPPTLHGLASGAQQLEVVQVRTPLDDAGSVATSRPDAMHGAH
jgi:hypothetical protein